MKHYEDLLPRIGDVRDRIDAKKAKIEHFLKYSAELGTLESAPSRDLVDKKSQIGVVSLSALLSDKGF